MVYNQHENRCSFRQLSYQTKGRNRIDDLQVVALQSLSTFVCDIASSGTPAAWLNVPTECRQAHPGLLQLLQWVTASPPLTVPAPVQINVVGPFALTHHLQPALARAEAARLVMVASVMHRRTVLPEDLATFFTYVPFRPFKTLEGSSRPCHILHIRPFQTARKVLSDIMQGDLEFHLMEVKLVIPVPPASSKALQTTCKECHVTEYFTSNLCAASAVDLLAADGSQLCHLLHVRGKFSGKYPRNTT